ncbi:MAG TPA: Hpt domain-containing protein [Microlunatus sp.]
MTGSESGTPATEENALDRVAGIFDRARERNLGRAHELAGWVKVAEERRLTATDRAEAKEVAHQLAGSAGTFGYQAATELAREIEKLFSDGDGASSWASARAHVRELVQHLHQPPETDGCPGP